MEIILRHKGKDSWAGITKFKNCADYISSYITRSGNRYTGLTDVEQSELEKLLGYEKGHLSQYSDFWDTYCVKLTSRELILDTDNANDKLKYAFLKGHKRVANGISDISANKDYVLINKEGEAKEINIANKFKRDAIKEFDKMSLDDMRKCLRLYGYKSDSMSSELVEQKLFENVEKDPSRFFSKWVNNKTKDTEYLIEAAISKNVIRKSKNIYYYGTDIIGSSLGDTILFLDDKKNQDIRLVILQELEVK